MRKISINWSRVISTRYCEVRNARTFIVYTVCYLQGRRDDIHNLIIAIRNIGRKNQKVMKTMTLVSYRDWGVRGRKGIQKTATSEYST